MENVKAQKTVVIVGSGLVGSLMAHFMAIRGYQVEIYEKRDDFRSSKLVEGRSINLAMSVRARGALKFLGLEEEILKTGIPMKGRLIHTTSGEMKSILYDGVTKQCLYSVSRNFLNLRLIETLENNPNVKFFFNHKLIALESNQVEATFLNTQGGGKIQTKSDLIIGADGAYSAVRQEIQRNTLLSFSQTYIEHGYMELSIGPGEGTSMIPNHLHIWPRGTFMMIALPNLDNSWTVTLFMPFKMFDSLKTRELLLEFFHSTFPDFFKFCSEENLIGDFFRKRALPLVSVKCSPYHHGGKVVLMGDAAHAMVPFYGQGMNAGFEDCLIFYGILEETLDDFPRSIEMFTERRSEDAHTICDLAMYNYVEMRDLVTRPTYKLRKFLDEKLFALFPNTWIPLYNSVTFTNMGYKKCTENRQWQDAVLRWTVLCFAIAFIAIIFTNFF